MSANKWFNDFNLEGRAPYLLVCFPYSGAGANVFRPWAGALDNADVLAAQLPGRERRIVEPPIGDLEELVQSLVPALMSRIDRPYLLFGHSMGALIAYRIALELGRLGIRRPQRLIVSGYRSPELSSRNRSLHTLSDQEFIVELKKYGGTPDEILQHEETMQLLLPMIRADFRIHETYRHAPQPAADFPITAFTGKADHLVPNEDMLPWADKTAAGFEQRLFDGGHFFLHEQRDAVLGAIQEIVNEHIKDDIFTSLTRAPTAVGFQPAV
jgi:medium-chain acyl-[acyl-carrier-protein] hydrolase